MTKLTALIAKNLNKRGVKNSYEANITNQTASSTTVNHPILLQYKVPIGRSVPTESNRLLAAQEITTWFKIFNRYLLFLYK